ncbi:hypothetical protein BURPSPAST_E0305 [Burkholderia pseudomallei Pasteur 52237]|nr:hypothetical protein BURPSPAST_E0305 [Burkholderia pseudomallei Pasteur 52237]
MMCPISSDLLRTVEIPCDIRLWMIAGLLIIVSAINRVLGYRL